MDSLFLSSSKFQGEPGVSSLARCRQLAMCFRCRSWAGYTTNIFEFEFFDKDTSMSDVGEVSAGDFAHTTD
jgi:hypothetical protein